MSRSSAARAAAMFAPRAVCHQPRRWHQVGPGRAERLRLEQLPISSRQESPRIVAARDPVRVLAAASGSRSVATNSISPADTPTVPNSLPRDRAEEGLAELAVRQAVDQVGEMPLDLDPERRAAAHSRRSARSSASMVSLHHMLIQIDALDRILAGRHASRAPRSARRAARDGAKARVVVQEGLDHLLRAAHARTAPTRMPWRSPRLRGAGAAHDANARRRCRSGCAVPRANMREPDQAERNCCSSVLPVSAVIEEVPPLTVCVTASK